MTLKSLDTVSHTVRLNWAPYCLSPRRWRTGHRKIKPGTRPGYGVAVCSSGGTPCAVREIRSGGFGSIRGGRSVYQLDAGSNRWQCLLSRSCLGILLAANSVRTSLIRRIGEGEAPYARQVSVVPVVLFCWMGGRSALASTVRRWEAARTAPHVRSASEISW
jgi:hypothetical protein